MRNRWLMEDSGSDLKSVFMKIKDWDTGALAGYARKVGVDDDVVDQFKRSRDAEGLRGEILGHLFGDDVDRDLMKLGLI